MKPASIEYSAGQEVFIMKNNQPVATRIRAVKYVESLEAAKDPKTGEVTERINTSCVYGTFADVHNPVTANNIGITKEDLLSKLFGTGETS